MAQLNGNQKYGLGGSHSRSSSQPQFFSSNNCLPPLSPLPHSESSLASSSSVKDVSMEEVDVSSRAPPLPGSSSSYSYENAFRGNFESLPPRKGHRRSNSDVPLGFSDMIQTSPQLVPISGQGVFGQSNTVNNKFGFNKPIRMQKQETDVISDSMSHLEGRGDRRSEGEVVDDLFRSYMHLENTDGRNASSSEDKDKGKIVSTTKRSGGYSFKNEGESTPVENGIEEMGPREGIKRSAAEDIAPTSRHFRSLSVDSAFGNFNFGDESPKLPPSGGNRVGQFLPRNSVQENLGKFSLEFGNGEFSDSEVKKIMTDERLAEIALSDPKRAKRILANRQSAARSKERKLRYISELEHKVQTLQTEATTLSTQLTILQKDFTELTNQNNELKFRLKAMEQQAQLRDALHEALTAEVQRLKVTSSELTEEGGASSCPIQQMPLNHHHMLQIQHQLRHSTQLQQKYSVPTSNTTTTTSATPSA